MCLRKFLLHAGQGWECLLKGLVTARVSVSKQAASDGLPELISLSNVRWRMMSPLVGPPGHGVCQ